MLESLLPELFAHVLDSLELVDLYSLRLTSRQLERKSVKAFGTAAFSKIRVDFCSANLQWIRKIANHDDFRLAVRSVWVGEWEGKVTGTRYYYETSYGLDGHWPRLENGSLDYGACEPAQQFVDSLLRFPNCITVTVTDEKLALSYIPQYGGPEKHLSSADAMNLTLYALSSPKASLLRHFQTRICRGIDWYPPGSITSTAVSLAKKTLDRLEELTLELSIEDGESVANLLQLITTRPDLRTLRIRWPRCLELLLPKHLDSLPHFTPPRLENLLLWGPRIDEKNLKWLLSNSLDTLVRLDLGHVSLTSGSWINILEHLRAAPFRKLRRFSMFACRHGTAEESIAFCPLWKRHKERKKSPTREPSGASLQFRISKTAKSPPRTFHITGALFEYAADPDTTERALREMMEYSHRCPAVYDPGPPCVEPPEMRRVGEEGRGGEASCLRELWTGLP